MKIEVKATDIADLPIAKSFEEFDISAISKPIDVQVSWQLQPRLCVGDVVVIDGCRYRVAFAEYAGEALELQVEPLQ